MAQEAKEDKSVVTTERRRESVSAFSLFNSYGDSRNQLVHNTTLDIYDEAHKLRRTSIICTIGPASRSVEMLTKLLKTGLDVVRLNFSHGTHDYHRQTIQNAWEAGKGLKKDVTIALDTKGPEIRTGNFVDDKEVILELGAKVRLTTDEQYYKKGTKDMFYVDYKNITKVTKKGDTVFIDDGLVSLKIDSIGKDYLDTIVQNSGAVSNHKGVNLPNVDVDLPAISEKDKNDLKFGVEMGVDMVFASFVRKPQDVLDIRKALISYDAKVGKRILIISKIENHEGVRNFDAILQVTDGVMVARGDLGIEIAAEKVFLAQKMMIAKCNIAGKPVIVATQMLESMIRNPRPTRAEVSDVANAVLDGADCVMLSGEVAKGKYPCESVNIMARICREAESAFNAFQYFSHVREALKKPLKTPETIASSAVSSCYEQQARCLIVLTNSGSTARIITKFRAPCPVVAVVGQSCAYTARQLKLCHGVFAVTYDDGKDGVNKKSADERVRVGLAYAKAHNWIESGDFVVAVHADTMGKGFANLVKIVVVD